MHYVIRMTYIGISSGWVTANSLCHPDDIPPTLKSSGWHTIPSYVIGMTLLRLVPYLDELRRIHYHNLCHPNEIVDFQLSQYAVALRVRLELPWLHIDLTWWNLNSWSSESGVICTWCTIKNHQRLQCGAALSSIIRISHKRSPLVACRELTGVITSCSWCYMIFYDCYMIIKRKILQSMLYISALWYFDISVIYPPKYFV